MDAGWQAAGLVNSLTSPTGTLASAASRKEIKRLKVAPGDSGDGGVFVMPDPSRA